MSVTTRGGVFISNARSTTSATDGRATGHVFGRNHMRLLISAALLVALFGIGGTGIDLAAAPSTSAVPVRVTFADGPAHKIASDLLGPYQNGSGVSATIDPSRNGELIFYSVKTGKVAARRFTLTFDDCIGTCDAVPFVSSLATAQLIAGVRQPDGTPQPGGMLTMPVGATGFRAGLKVYLVSTPWTLCLTPGDAGGFCANSTGDNSSTPTRIVRTANDKWTISADAVDPRSDVGALFTETSSGRSTTITLQGKYAMPFSMMVQCVNAANCPVP
jgi:hypothetical protein